MHETLKKTAIASVLALSLSAAAGSSPALAFGGNTWHGGHGGWGGAAVGAGIGVAAGTLAGAALASPYGYYGGYCDPYYGCGYGYGYGYGYGPSYSPGYYDGGFGPQYPLAPNYPYYSTGGNSGGANFPP